MKTRHWNQQACVAVQRDCVSQLQQQYRLTEFDPLPRNFRVYAEFREIPRKHRNSTTTAKFRGSARNSAACGKLWALLMTLQIWRTFPLLHASTCMWNCHSWNCTRLYSCQVENWHVNCHHSSLNLLYWKEHKTMIMMMMMVVVVVLL